MTQQHFFFFPSPSWCGKHFCFLSAIFKNKRKFGSPRAVLTGGGSADNLESQRRRRKTKTFQGPSHKFSKTFSCFVSCHVGYVDCVNDSSDHELQMDCRTRVTFLKEPRWTFQCRKAFPLFATRFLFLTNLSPKDSKSIIYWHCDIKPKAGGSEKHRKKREKLFF